MRHSFHYRAGLTVLAWCLATASAQAFPLATEGTPTFIPLGADLAQPDARDLQRQMGLTSGFASLGSTRGWTILPRLSVEEQFTDNVLQVPAPRHWDLSTIVAPGVAVLGNSDRAQLRLDYEPDLDMHMRESSQNILAQQLDATGLFTVVKDLFFVDVRAVAGTQAVNGGIGGIGGLGQGGIGGITGSALTPGTEGGTLGLSRQNRSETTSASISPYLLYQFGEFGDGRIGVSATRSSSAPVSGFAPIPFAPTAGNSQSFTALQENAWFETGPQFSRLRDQVTANGEQGEGSGIGTRSTQRDLVSNRVDYQINRTFDVYGSIGWELINYSGNNALAINDMTWEVGTTITPNPDSSLTLGYGHQNGTNSVTASGRYAVTARTVITGSYSSGVGTQLEQIANQLNAAAVGNNGGLVNAQTGGELFAANNALGVQAGIFRFTNATIGLTTVLDRDTITINATHAHETRVGNGANGSSSDVTAGTVSWTHQLSPVLSSSATVSYSAGTPTAGFNSNSLLAGLSLQYILSDTLSLFARYNYYNVQASTAGQSWYQDVVLVGFTKQF